MDGSCWMSQNKSLALLSLPQCTASRPMPPVSLHERAEFFLENGGHLEHIEPANFGLASMPSP